MYRRLAISTLFFSLLLAACTPATAPNAPAETSAPTVVATATDVAESPTTTATETVTTETATTESATTETTTATITAEAVTTATVTADAVTTATVTAGTVTTATVTAGTVTTQTVVAGCPEAIADTQVIANTAQGFCFLIPADFDFSEFNTPDGYSIGLYGTPTATAHRERGFVDVREVATQTLESSVQSVISDVIAALPAFTPTQTSLTLGGVPAIQLDNLPGQDINRKVFAVHEGRLYQLTFMPFDANLPVAQAEMEQLYTLMISSFSFIPITEATTSGTALLSWEGEIDGACYTLTIQPDGEAAVGACGDAPSKTTSMAENSEWAAVQQQFGNINAETTAGKITFQGQGRADSDLWAQALATWANFTAMEINAGRSSASVRTTLAWQLTDTAEHSGQCSQLVVLAYGYAYANQIPCDGNGQATQVAAGWLADTELDTFYDWVNNGARVESEAGYLDVKGSTPITPEEITNWANAVYFRLLQ
jgi:hypothetical protein